MGLAHRGRIATSGVIVLGTRAQSLTQPSTLFRQCLCTLGIFAAGFFSCFVWLLFG